MIETTALLVKGKKTSGHDNGERQQHCSHCNKLNHTKETCYQLVGYPSHWTRKLTRDARFGGYVNVPHTGVGAALAATVSNPDIQNQSPIPGLTVAQHQQLIALLGGSSVNTGSTPNPTANFVVSKLARDLNCALTFWADLCVIQDLPSMRPIGAGRERNGLYYLERMGTGKALMANAKQDAALWHRRLGHIPMNRLTLVSSLSFLSDNKEPWVCDACWYPNGKKGYRIFDLEDKHIYTSRDVQFFEENYPFARHNTFVAPHESQQPDSSVFGPHATMDSPLDVVHARNKPDDIIQTAVPSSESNCAIPGLHSNEQQTEPKEVVEGSDPNKIISGASDDNNLTPESNSSLSEISIPAKRVRKPHLDAALQVLRYLKGVPGQGILLPANSSLTLRAYCDADWAGCPSTRRSTTGYIIFLGSSPISWRSKKQSVVSRSSAEAEYRAMATTSSEIIWLVRLLQDLHVPCTSPVSLFCDNQAAIHIAANPVFHERTKHIEIDCHFIRQHIQSQVLIPKSISSQFQLADIFTKALGRNHFHDLLVKLGIFNLHAPA
ncbi:hypothetical protein RJ639_042226 [Escallonia herrerae]|uniref:GAG-pre-integrase domain-containing protein n=1 Tax=Escallonia herrerae TaxID=1293975 RepID=A0AA89BCJ6_9ASTE|nr:hypothetical protein RJ639_042226 [Escallonia herrerae]